MKLNRVETTMMNNPLRALLQWRYEAPLLERLGGRTNGLRVLEVGCGRGVGTQIIFERFGAAHVTAFDLDPDMVAQARRRLAGRPPARLRLFVGDVTAIDGPDEAFDAVFDFGAIHHVPAWLVLAWKTAGWIGLDRWLLAALGTPWRPGRPFRPAGAPVAPTGPHSVHR